MTHRVNEQELAAGWELSQTESEGPLRCCSGFLTAWWLDSKSENYNRPEVETDSFLKPRSRNRHGLVFTTAYRLKQPNIPGSKGGDINLTSK